MGKAKYDKQSDGWHRFLSLEFVISKDYPKGVYELKKGMGFDTGANAQVQVFTKKEFKILKRLIKGMPSRDNKSRK